MMCSYFCNTDNKNNKTLFKLYKQKGFWKVKNKKLNRTK